MDRYVTRGSALLPVASAILGPRGWPVLLVTGAGFGVVAGWSESAERDGRETALAPDRWSPSHPVSWSGCGTLRLTGWPAARDGGGWRAPAVLVAFGETATDPDHLQPLVGQGVLVSCDGPPATMGSLVSGVLDLRVPSTTTVAGGFDYREFLAGRGLCWQGWLTVPEITDKALVRDHPLGRILDRLRRAVVGRLQTALPPPEAAIMSAVLLGVRSDASRLAARPFSDLGMAHLFAVSGLHVGILVAMVLMPLRAAGLPRGPVTAVVLILLLLYVLLTGMPGSVIRAAGLTALALGAGQLGRRTDALQLLGLLFWATTVWEPRQVLDTGVRLSYLAAGGILALQPALSTGGLLRWDGPVGKVSAPLSVSLAAQWFTLPQVAASFGRISAWSPLANLLGVPFFGFAVWLVVMGLTAGTIWPWLGEGLLAGGWLVLRLLSAGAGRVGAWSISAEIGLPVPGPVKLLLFAVLSVGLLALLHGMRLRGLQRRLRVTGVLLILVVGAGWLMPAGRQLWRPGSVEAWQFDVGQGDCCLLAFPDRWCGLIDTGGRNGRSSWLARDLLPLLRRHGQRSLAAVVLTHGHLDHTAGAVDLQEAVVVDRWYVGGRAGEALTGHVDSTRVLAPTAGHLLHRCGDWRLVCQGALGNGPGPDGTGTEPGSAGEDHDDGALHENDRSLVIGLWLGERPVMLWTGDLEEDGERRLLAAGSLPQGPNVLKAGHHGSNTSSSRAFLEHVAPRYVLVSCGVDNRYRHPSHGPYVVAGDTLPLCRSDLDGTVHLVCRPDGAVWLSAGDARGKARRVPVP